MAVRRGLLKRTAELGHASLREDYLNQVQRDFLSLGSSTSAPPACLHECKYPDYAWLDKSNAQAGNQANQTPSNLCKRGEAVVYSSGIFWPGFR